MSRLKWLFGRLLPAAAAVCLSTFTWADLGTYQIPVCAAAVLLLTCGIAVFMRSRRAAVKDEQYRILLEHLSGRLAAGHTLETALIRAAEDLSVRLGRRNPLRRSLLRLNQEIGAQLDLKSSLTRFQSDFSCLSSQSFFDLLPFLRSFGGRLDIFVGQTYRSLCAELQLKKDLTAEQSAKNSEAIVLSTLPFVLSLILLHSRSSYLDSLAGGTWTAGVLAVLFLTSHAAIALTLWILSQHIGTGKTDAILLKLSARPVKSRIIQSLAEHARSLTGLFGYRLGHAVQILLNGDESAWPRYIRKKICLLACTLLSALALGLGRIIPIQFTLLCLPLIWFLPDLDVLQRERRLRQQIRLEYPQFLNAMVVLLKSGLTLDRSLRLMIDSYAKRTESQLNRDLNRIRSSLGRGEHAARAIDQLSDDIPQTEIASILQLMSRYDRDGGRELLEIMQIQAAASWQLYRNAVRSRLERRNLRLILPMGIDLLTIIILAMLPAIASLAALR